mgnify:CR=1 FL=1
MRELLYKLLKTPSPSGAELNIQKLVIEEMKDVADKVITHHNYNIINVINPDSPTKILLCGHIDEISLYIEKINSDGTCKLARAGGIRPHMYAGHHVRVINQKNEEVYGVIGYTPNMEKLKQYLSLEDNENMDYDYFIVDTDSFQGISAFGLQGADNKYFVTSFDAYSMRKGIEILSQLGVPTHITRVFFTKEMLKEEEDYFDYLALGIKAIWNDDKLYFPLENGDLPAIMENQRISKIKLKNLSGEYVDNIKFIANDIAPEIGEKTIKNIIKEYSKTTVNFPEEVKRDVSDDIKIQSKKF